MDVAGLVLSWLTEIGFFAVSLAYLCSPTRTRAVTVLTLASFGLRALIGEVMYGISLLHLPILRNLQLPDGFWAFAPDGHYYDGMAQVFATSIMHGQLPPGIQRPFNAVIGVVYLVFGSNPSQAFAFNAACAAACIPLGYVVARQAGIHQRAALAAAALIGFWPSSFAWSGQLLKDPLQWLEAFALIAGASMLLIHKPMTRRRVSTALSLLVAGGLITAALRSYTLVGLAAGLCVAVAIFAIRNWSTHRRTAIACAAMLGLLTAGAILVTFQQLSLPSLESNPQATSAAELAVWNARPDIRQSFRADYPQLSPLEAMDRWTAAYDLDAGSDIVAYATALTGEDFSRGPFPAVKPHGPLACPPFAALVIARYRYDADGGTSLVDPGMQFNSCRDILAYMPRALEITFLFPLPSAWTGGSSVGPARYLSALDAALLWLLVPGLLFGCWSAIRHPKGVNVAIVVAILLLGAGLGLTVTNFGTLFRLRLGTLLLATIPAADGWWQLAAWARQTMHAISAPLGDGIDRPATTQQRP
ncbi:MAG TPA: hypothetical protein VKU60_07170 [Chloroflexota bacterium]|nr:hypothetical protein [Chloroflexota bacterium]